MALAQLLCYAGAFKSSLKGDVHRVVPSIDPLIESLIEELHEALANLHILFKKDTTTILLDSTLNVSLKYLGKLLLQHKSYLFADQQTRLQLFLTYFDDA